MIRRRSTVVCSASAFLWQAENSSRSPSDLWNTLKPHWNLWQKLLFLLAFENHLLFLRLGHLLFRLVVNVILSARRSLAHVILLVWQGQKGEGQGEGEKNAKGKMEYQERNIYLFRPPRCLQTTIINSFWAQYCK